MRSRCSHVWYSYTTVPGYHLRIILIWTGRPTFSCAAVPNFLNPQTNSPMLGVHENLMLHCSAQCQQDLPTMPTGRDPTTRRSRRSKKPRKTRGARRSAPPENNLAHARPKGPLRSPRSTMSSHRSGETFGRHARAIAKRGSLVARCSSLTSCRGVVLYAFGLHFADVHRSCFGLHFAVLRSASLVQSLQNARRDQ